MTCSRIDTPAGSAIVCGPTKRCKCGRKATLACDWKVPKRKSGTCDRALCSTCATSPAEGKHLCPPHVEAYEEWKAAPRGSLWLEPSETTAERQ